MARSGATGSIYAKGVRDSNGNILSAECINPRIYEAVVSATGGTCDGDYNLPSAAFAAGAKSVFVRSGVYNETTNVVLPENGCMYGEEGGGAIINFIGSFGIVADGNGGITETAGTVSVTQSTSAVTGVGTTFTNLSSGEFILLGNNFHKIDTVTDNTNLTIVETYNGITLSGVTWIGQAMLGGVCIDRISVKGSSSNGLFLRAVNRGSIKTMLVEGCTGNNMHIEDCAYLLMESTTSKDSGASGFFVDNSIGCNLSGCIGNNNVVNGLFLDNNSTDMTLDGCGFMNNGAQGVLGINGVNNINVTDCIVCYNGDDGIDLQNTTFTINVVSCMTCHNATKGVDCDGTESTINSCIASFNGSEGISAGDHSTITGNHAANNALQGINLRNDDFVSVTGNICNNNTLQGIFVDKTDNATLIGNVCQGNIGNGIEIDTDADRTLMVGNYCSGNAIEIVDNGTNTIKGHNIDGQADGLPYLQRRFQTVKTTNTQNINVGTPVTITFNANEYTSSEFSHTSGSGNITINTTGTYRVSYQINHVGDGSRKNIRTAVYVNGTEDIATRAHSYTRNSNNDLGTNYCAGYERSLTAANVVTIRGSQEGDGGTENTNLGECWVRIERIS